MRHQIVTVETTRDHAAAAAFIKRLTGKAGRKLLVANGFGVSKLPPKKEPPKKHKKKSKRARPRRH